MVSLKRGSNYPKRSLVWDLYILVGHDLFLISLTTKKGKRNLLSGV
jgi:hypothetical protein